MQRACDLVQRQVEVEVEDQRQALVRAEPSHGPPEVTDGLLTGGVAAMLAFDVCRFHVRPPAPAPRHAALVGDDGQAPRAQRALVPPKLPQFAHPYPPCLTDATFSAQAIGYH